MSKHTPGPWHTDIFSLQVLSENSLGICQLQAQFGSDPFPNYRANARLISAAPDLLEALKMYELFANEAEEHGETPVSRTLLRAARSQARAAIAKAEGEAV